MDELWLRFIAEYGINESVKFLLFQGSLQYSKMSEPYYFYHSGQQSLYTRYDPLFNFYMAKDITDICHSRPHSTQVIHFEDFLRLDCEDEMLKRYYHLNEVSRINLLAEYYARNRVLENQSPAIYLTSGGKFMQKRIKRRVKRQEHKREQDEDYVYEGKSTFLKSIDSQDVRNAEEEPDLLGDMSMETEVYNVYEEEGNGLSQRKDMERTRGWKSIFSLEENEDQNQGEDVLPGNLVMDFKAMDHERILKEYTLLQNTNSSKIPPQRNPGKSAKHYEPSSIQNKNATVLKKSEHKAKDSGRAYVVKGLPATKKYIRLDEQYLQQIGINKQRRFIKGFQTEMQQGWRSPKTKSNHLKIYSPDQPYQKFHQIKSKNRDTEYLRSPPRQSQYINLHSKSPQIDSRLHRIQTISSQSKWRTQQYQALKQKAEEVEEQALRTIYRFANKNMRSTDYLGGGQRER